MRPFLFLSFFGLLGSAAAPKSTPAPSLASPHEYYAVVVSATTHKPLQGIRAHVTQSDVSRTAVTASNGRFTIDVMNDASLHIRLMAYGYTPVAYDRTPYCSWPDTLAISPAPPSIHQLPSDY